MFFCNGLRDPWLFDLSAKAIVVRLLPHLGLLMPSECSPFTPSSPDLKVFHVGWIMKVIEVQFLIPISPYVLDDKFQLDNISPNQSMANSVAPEMEVRSYRTAQESPIRANKSSSRSTRFFSSPTSASQVSLYLTHKEHAAFPTLPTPEPSSSDTWEGNDLSAQPSPPHTSSFTSSSMDSHLHPYQSTPHSRIKTTQPKQGAKRSRADVELDLSQDSIKKPRVSSRRGSGIVDSHKVPSSLLRKTPRIQPEGNEAFKRFQRALERRKSMSSRASDPNTSINTSSPLDALKLSTAGNSTTSFYSCESNYRLNKSVTAGNPHTRVEEVDFWKYNMGQASTSAPDLPIQVSVASALKALSGLPRNDTCVFVPGAVHLGKEMVCIDTGRKRSSV
ncbi:hypothetical protein JAAARDRAFT_204242 [Jaapia argillacea MUCL 33604]|uniref:Uncharacterized protein n=1 Tax=Jaapia argillacea MUCL 33604 TaxID=933084 RepID=A0A067Q6M8_9AGAM|nr:hypothetical protein JAAARDRAFT_204242 [Jaapia argillacea MUCL 33604]